MRAGMCGRCGRNNGLVFRRSSVASQRSQCLCILVPVFDSSTGTAVWCGVPVFASCTSTAVWCGVPVFASCSGTAVWCGVPVFASCSGTAVWCGVPVFACTAGTAVWCGEPQYETLSLSGLAMRLIQNRSLWFVICHNAISAANVTSGQNTLL